MALELTRQSKEYAEQGTTSGVPIADLETIVGTLVERFRHTETISTASTGATAVRINYKPLQFATEYRIFLTNSAGAILLNGTINALTWQGLVHAAVGDTLVHDGRNTQTGHSLAPPHGDPAIDQNIVVGRTDDNFMLIQGIALADQNVLSVFSTEFSGGAIEERSWRQTAAAPHVLRLKILTTATPEAPPDLGYDGSFATGLDGTGWVEIHEQFPDPSLSGATVYQLRANAVYNPLAGRWLISNIEIFSPEGGVSVEFAVSDTGPWHATQAATDLWRRWRDSTGYWHVEPLNELDDGWRFLTSFQWDGGQDPDPGVYTEWTKALSMPVDFADWKHLLMELEWSPTSGSEFILVPFNVMSSGPVLTTGFSAGIGRVMHFRRNNNGASYDDSKFDATRRSTGNILGFRYQFLHGTGEDSSTASLVRVIITGTGVIATLRYYVGR